MHRTVCLRFMPFFSPLFALLTNGVFLLQGGCSPAGVVRKHPVVSLQQPKGAVLYVSKGSKVVRIPFDGNTILAPFVCKANPVVIDMRSPKEKKRSTFKWLAAKPGSRRVSIADASGKVLLRGRMCIFPTYETPTMSILSGYTIRIPVAKLQRRPRGKPAFVFQAYRAAHRKNKHLKHLGWILWLAPR
jgi:hypothetical protein